MTSDVPSIETSIRDDVARRRPASLWRDTLSSVLRQRSARVGLIILGLLIFTAVFADVIAPYDPVTDDFVGEVGAARRAGPCIHLLGCPAEQRQHLLGLDGNVRDVFSRIVHGSRISLQVGLVTVTFAIIAGTILGAVAGYAGGWADNVIMRLMDVLLAFPALVLAIAIVAVIGSGLFNAMIAIAIVSVPIYARVMRASVLSIRERDYVVASRALGESSIGILLRRVLPNALTPLVVQGTLGIATAILEVAALSFIGLGASLPTAEWGSMIGLERNSVFAAPHLIFAPGFALVLTVLGFNLLGDGLRDALDPRLNR